MEMETSAPQLWDDRITAATAIMKSGNYAEAILSFAHLLEFTGHDDYDAIAGLSLCHSSTGLWDAGERYARLMIAKKPTKTKGYLYLARSLLGSSKFRLALAACDEGLAHLSSDRALLQTRGMCERALDGTAEPTATVWADVEGGHDHNHHYSSSGHSHEHDTHHSHEHDTHHSHEHDTHHSHGHDTHHSRSHAHEHDTHNEDGHERHS